MYWNYFLALEDDLINISRFIEFDERNYSTFSTENAKLMLAACSEIDVWMKELCRLIDGKKPKNLPSCRNIIQKEFICFTAEEVLVRGYGIYAQPWSCWSSSESPEWWNEYNQLKHHRLQSYDKASLKNVIESMAALLLVIIYYHTRSTSTPPFAAKALSPPSKLFRLATTSPVSFPYETDVRWRY